MSATAAMLVVVAVGAMTYAMRAAAIVVLAGRAIPPLAERALRQVGPAVLAALAINLAAGGEGGPSLDAAEAVALAAGGLAAWRWRNLLVALAAGMTVLWVAGALL